MWCCLRDSFGWEGFPTSSSDLLDGWLSKPDKNKNLGLFFFAGFLWAIWRVRNKMAIERKFPRKPTEIMLYGLSFLQKWAR